MHTATLSIQLQEGFEDDTVIIEVNDKAVFREDGVRTKLLLGYAASVDVPVRTDRSPAEVLVRLPKKQLTEKMRVPVTDDTYLGISVEDGKITHLVSQQPFGYG